jgi:phosphoribosylformylglycinamidine synthase
VIGKVEGEAFSVEGLFSIPLETLRKAHEAWMPAFMGAA